MKEKFISGFILILLALSTLSTWAYAHSAGEHWKEMDRVLFNDENIMHKSKDSVKNNIRILRYATQLSIDQFGMKSGKQYLDELQKLGVARLPGSIDDIALYPMDTDHRSYSHLGLDHDYSDHNDPRNRNWSTQTWPKRREILLSSIEKVFNFNNLPDIADSAFGVHTDKGDAFARFLYCIHILGDHIEYRASTYASGYQQVLPLGATRGESVISEIISTFPFLFPTQNYSELERSLLDINTQVCKLLNTPSFWETNFNDYNNAAKDVLKALENNVSELLKQEEYFKRAFYPSH